MAIKSELIYKGLVAPTAYTRVRAVNVDAGGTEIKVHVTLQDYATEADAAKVLEEITEMSTPDLDLANPEHQAYVAEYAAKNGYSDTPESQAKLQADLVGWRPTIYKKVQKWMGKRAGEPLQERSVELTLEEAVAILTMSVPGQPPEDVPDNLTSQIYRALMASGRFTKAEVV